MIFLWCLLITAVCWADDDTPTFTSKFSENIDLIGYLKVDLFSDTREGLFIRDGHSYLFPLKKECPCNGDIHKFGDYDIVAIETNFGFKVKGPAVWNTQETYALLTADFWGTRDIFLNDYRLKQGYVRFIWKDRDLTVGHTFNGFFVEDCYPGTIAYNFGDPLESQICVPQIMYRDRSLPVKMRFVAAMEIDSPSFGPIGYSTTYIRDSYMPHMTFDMRVGDEQRFLGAAIDVKRLVPRLTTDALCRVHESVVGVSAQIYGEIFAGDCKIQSKIWYGENLTELGYLNGFAVRSERPDGSRTYAPLRCITWWLDASRTEGVLRPGALVGFTYNLGAGHALRIDPSTNEPTVYATSPHAQYAIKIMPRVRLSYEHVMWGFECEYSQARYGVMNDFARVVPTQSPVHNVRLDFAAYYFF